MYFVIWSIELSSFVSELEITVFSFDNLFAIVMIHIRNMILLLRFWLVIKNLNVANQSLNWWNSIRQPTYVDIMQNQLVWWKPWCDARHFVPHHCFHHTPSIPLTLGEFSPHFDKIYRNSTIKNGVTVFISFCKSNIYENYLKNDEILPGDFYCTNR